MHIELIGPREDQARVLLEASADSDDVETVFLEQIVGQVSIVNHADNTDGQLIANSFLDLDGERRLVCRACVRVLQWVVAARADVQDVNTVVSQDAGELDSVVYGPGLGDFGDLLEPVGGGDAEEERHFLGDDLAGLFDELDGEAGAVLETAAIVVLTVVGDWGEEGVDEVAMSLVGISNVVIRLVVKNLHRESQWRQSLPSRRA